MAIDRALSDFRTEYDHGLIVATCPYPGIAELLAALTQHGLPLGVLSNKPDDWTRRIVLELFATVPFAEVHGQRASVPRKPDPTAAIELARALAVSPERVAFVGDTEVDMQTARAAGMQPVGVGWGFAPESVLREAGATHVVGSAAELCALLMGDG